MGPRLCKDEIADHHAQLPVAQHRRDKLKLLRWLEDLSHLSDRALFPPQVIGNEILIEPSEPPTCHPGRNYRAFALLEDA